MVLDIQMDLKWNFKQKIYFGCHIVHTSETEVRNIISFARLPHGWRGFDSLLAGQVSDHTAPVK